MTLAITDDLLDEPNETIVLTLGTPTNALVGSPGSRTLTLLDNDGLPEVSFDTATSSIGESVGLATISASLSVPSGDAVSVPVMVTGSATLNTDFAIAPATLQFAPGETLGSVTVIVIDDALSEDDETIALTFGTPVGAEIGAISSRTLSILDDDPLPTVIVGAPLLERDEDAGAVALPISLDAPAGRDIVVTLTREGAASEGFDLQAVPDTVTVPAGQTQILLDLQIIDDASDEPTESWILTLESTGSSVMGAPSICELRILDNDDPPIAELSVASQGGAEGDTLTVTVELSAPSGFEVTVPIDFAGDAEAGSDYFPSATEVVFPTGTASGAITLDLIPDLVFEGDETIEVSLGSPILAQLAGQTTQSITILDGEDSPEVSFSTAVVTATEGNGLVRLGVNVSGPSEDPLEIPWTSTGTATLDADLVLAPNPIVVPPGALSTTLTLIVIDDTIAEPTEGVAVTLVPPATAALGAVPTVQITILDNGDPAPLLGFTTSFTEVGEGSGTILLTVTLASPTGNAVLVPYSVTGDASQGIDYSVATSPLIIDAGATSATIAVSIIEDAVDEPNENLTVALGIPIGANLGTVTTSTVRILDNDAAPTVRFASTGQTLPEGGGSVTVEVLLDGVSSAPVTVSLATAGDATVGDDVAPFPTSLTIPAGAPSASFPLTILDDLAIETDESLVLTLGSPIGATLGTPASHSVTIADDDVLPVVEFTSPNVSALEDSGLVPLSIGLSSPSATDTVVHLAMAGTALASADYGLAPNPVVIPAGTMSGAAQLFILNDSIHEPDETVEITLTSIGGGDLGQEITRTVTILDDGDSPPVIQFAQISQGLGEATAGASITVGLSGPSGFDLVVPILRGGSATEGPDYSITPSELTIPAGASFGLLQVTPVSDLLDEPEESIELEIGTVAQATVGANSLHSITLIDDDAPPALFFDSPTLTIGEGDAQIAVTLSLDAPSAFDVVVPLTYGGLATTGTDYSLLPATVTIPAGSIGESLLLAPIDDLAIEGDEDVTIAMGVPQNATAIAPQICSVTIIDDDLLPTVNFKTASQVIGEDSGSTSITVSIASATAENVVVPIIFGGSAQHFSDFVATPLPVTIPAGQTSATITVILLDDTLHEGVEDALFTFGTITGGQAGAQAAHAITITDAGDPLPTVGFTIASQTIAEGTSSASMEVRLSAVSGLPVTVPLSISGTALLGTDLILTGNQVTIPAGQLAVNFPLTVVDDALDEPIESATFDLGVPTGATSAGITTHVVTLLDNDDAPSISFATRSASAPENSGSTTILAQLSAPSAFNVTVALAVGGSATEGLDYSFAPSSLSIPAGETEAFVTVTFVDDLAVEVDETITLTLGSATNATLAAPAAHTLTILDNDLLPTVTFQSAEQTVGEDAGIVSISVLLSAPTATDVIVPISRAGTATVGQDYTLSPNPLTILAGQTSATLQLVLIDDALNELSETLFITLGTPTNGTLGTANSHTVTILDVGDSVPTVFFTQPSQSTLESPDTVLVPITLSAASGQDVILPVTFAGTATNGSDYVASTDPQVIPAGQTSHLLAIALIDDLAFEATETLILSLGSPTGASLGVTVNHTVTIADGDPLPTVSFASPASTIGEGSGATSVSVTLSAIAGIDVTVPFTLGGSAIPGEDYDEPTTPLTIPAGSLSASIPFALVDDGLSESDETATITLGSPTNALLGSPGSHLLTIGDNEGIPEVSFAVAAQSVTEGNILLTLDLILSIPTGVEVTVPYSVAGSATPGLDFALAAGPAVIPAGATSASLSLVLIDDAIDELAETIEITLGAPLAAVLGTPHATIVTITDNGDLPPSIGFSLATSAVNENQGIANVAVTLDRPSGQEITIPYTVGGTALFGSDHFVIPGPLSIPAGTLSAVIPVNVVDDLLDEPTETVTLALGTPSSGSLGALSVHTLDLLDDDSAPTIAFENTAVNAFENEGTLAVRVLLDLPSGHDILVPFTTTGSATAGADFTPAASPLTIPTGATEATIALALIDDPLFEGVESIVLTLGSPTGATVIAPSTFTVTLLDDEELPLVSFAQATGQVNESVGSFTVDVTLSIPTSEDVIVPLSIGGSADPIVDFAVAAGPVVIPAGATSTTLTVVVHEDLLDEANETITLGLGAPTGASAGSILVHSTTINDDDPPASASFLTSSTSVVEGSGAFTVSVGLSGPSGRDVTLAWNVTGSALPNQDYMLTEGSVTIPAGDIAADFTIDVLGDAIDEANETIVLTLANLVDAVAGVPASMTLTILDDDTPPTVQFSSALSIEGEPAGTVLVPFTLSTPSGQDILIETLLAGTATHGLDYLFDPTPVRIVAGDSSGFLVVELLDDVQIEVDETISLTLLDPTNANLGSPSNHVITVLEDDIAPTVTITTPSQSLPENGGSSTVTIALSETTGIDVLIPFNVTGSAELGTDFTLTQSPVIIPAGQTTVDLSLAVIDDLHIEVDETVTITLAAPVNGVLGGNSSTTVTILDDEIVPVAEFTTTSLTTDETGPAAVLTVTLSQPSTLDVTIGASVLGTATSGSDYAIVGQPIVIPAGQTSAQVVITPIDDLLDETDETVIVTLETPNQAVLGTNVVATVTLTDNDVAPTVAFDLTSSATTEGLAAAEATVTLFAASGRDVTVPFTVTGSAGASDSTQSASPLVIVAGTTSGTISLLALADGLDEPDETVIWTLTTPQNATLGAATVHTVTITDADPPVSVQFAALATTIAEDGGALTIALELSAPSGQTIAVPLSASGTADLGVDAIFTPTSVTFAPGATTASVTVDVVDDGLSEADETFVLTIGSSTEATVGTRATHTVTIIDDEPLPTVTFDIASQSVIEDSGTALVTLTLSAPSGSALAIPLTVSGTATVTTDYLSPTTPILIAPGATTATVAIPLIDDTSDEPSESITLALGTSTGVQLGAISTHTITLEDNDLAPELSFTTEVATRDEASGSLTLDLTLSATSANPVTAPISYFGTATIGLDYTASATSVTFPPGSTTASLTLSFSDDAIDETSESIVVVIDSPSGATLGAIPVATITVLDNDDPPILTFATSASAAGESAAQIIVNVSLSTASGAPITVPFALGGTATNGSDYSISASPLVIPVGATSGAIVVNPIPDPVNEPNETIEITLGTPTGATLGTPLFHTATLQDESDLPSVFFDMGAQTRSEGSALANVVVRLSALSAIDVTVAIAASGTATMSLDVGSVPSTVVIPSGSDQATISVAIFDDSTDEPNETLVLEILGATDATTGLPDQHTVTITDNDAPPLVTISAPPGPFTEGAATISLTVSLDAASGQSISVPLLFTGSALLGADYNSSTQTALFAPGTTAVTVDLSLIDDPIHEGPESIVASLGAPTNANLGAATAVTLSLADDEPAPTVTFGATPSSVVESVGTITIPVHLSAPSALPLTVPFAVGGSASAISDYTLAVASVTIPAGATAASFDIDILDDLIRELDQTIDLALLAVANLTLGTPSSQTITIVDDEPIPVVSISPTLAVIPEAGGQAPLTITVSVPSEAPITVPLTYGGSASLANDLAPQPSSVVIAAGSTGAPLTLTAIDDLLFEHDETVTVTIGTPTNATPGPQGAATITILDDETRPVATISGPPTIAESAGTLVVQVTLTGPVGNDLTIPTTISGTATAGVDYTPPAGVWVIPAGSVTAELSIPLIDDPVDEGAETIVVTLGTPADADLGSPSVLSVTLTDDDPSPTLSFAQSAATVDESAGTISLTVTQSAPSSLAVAANLLIGGTADADDDVTITPTSVSIPAGQTSTTINLGVVDDGFDEPDETLTLTLDSPTNAILGGTSVFTLTVTDNDVIPAVQFDVSSVSFAEDAGAITATVDVSVPSALSITVPFTLLGTATDGSDFVIDASPLTIPAGASSATIGLTLTDDAIYETDQSLTIVLGTPVNATLGNRVSQQITILDNDSAPFVTFAAASSTALESAGSALIDVTLSAPAEVDIVVPLTLGGTATAGIDAQLVGNPILFGAGTTTVVAQVDLLDDALHEGDETLNLGFGATLGATPGAIAQHTLTITDDDAAPVVSFATASSAHDESAGTVAIAVLLSEPSALPTTIPYTISGSADDPSDFTATASPMVIPAGGTSGSIEIVLAEDLLAEGDETILLTLDPPTHATVGTPSTHTLTVLDNDVTPTVSFSAANQSVGEINGIAQIGVELSSPTGIDVTVPFTLAGTAVNGLDYVLPPGPLVIPAGTMSAQITLTLIDDALAEPDETVIATLGTPIGANLGTTITHTTTLLDDEATPVVEFATATQSVGEGATVTTVTVLLSSATAVDVTIPYLTSGTAHLPGDLTVTPTPLVILAGSLSASLTITVVDDLLDEIDETLEIALSTPTGAGLGASTVHTLTVIDNDAAPVVSFSLAATSVAEGAAPFSIAAELDAPSGLSITIPLTLAGDAGNAGDLQLGGNSLFFPAGSTTSSVTVTVIDDLLSETTETATLTLGAAPGVTLGTSQTHTITIVDNEAFPAVSFALATSNVGEELGSTLLGLVLDAPSAASVSVDVALSGEAAVGGDATIASATVVFPPGATTANLTIDLIDDAISEGDELLVATLTAPNGTQLGATTIHTLTVIDNDPVPSIAFTVAAQDLSESASAGQATLLLSGARDEDTVVSLTTGGTATGGVDAIALPTAVTIPAGQTSIDLTVTPLADIVDEPDETLVITIDAATGATIGTPATHTVTILDDDDAPQISFATPSFTLGEGDGTIGVGILSSAPSAQEITVLLTAGGTTTVGSDHALPPSPVVIPAGSTSTSVSIALIDDGLFERPEFLTLTLSAPQNATLGSTTITSVTILDDDPAPVVRFDGASVSVDEFAGTLDLTVLLDATTAVAIDVPFTLGGSALEGVDYTIAASPLTIPAGSLSATLSIALADDTDEESSETIIVTLGTPSDGSLGSPSATTVTILDDDAPTQASFTLGTSTASEGAGLVTIAVELTQPLPTSVTLPITVSGSATDGLDFASATTSVTIPAGLIAGDASLILLDDLIDELDETVLLTLGAAPGASLGAIDQHLLTITDDDAEPVLTLVETAVTVGEAQGTVQLTVNLDAPSGLDVTAPFTLTGSATNGEDYVASTSPITILAGSTLATITITPSDDIWFEVDETIIVTLDAPTNATLGANLTATVTVTDDDPFPSVTFDSAGESVAEAAGTRTIGLTLSSPSDTDVVIPLLLGGTATDGVDYVIATASAVIPARTLTGDFDVTITQDTIDELTENLTITLDNPVGASLGAIATHTITILDDDPLPLVQFSVPTATVAEGNTTVTMALALSGESSQTITVPFTLAGTATENLDYTIPAGPITFAPGETIVFVDVTILDDLFAEGDEIFQVILGTPTLATLGTETTFTGTITDNESTATISFTTATSTIDEAGGSVVATLELSIASPIDLSFPLVIGGTATDTVDHVASPNPVLIPAGSLTGTVAVLVTNDLLDELDETVTLTIDPPSGTVLGTIPTHTVTITDDDLPPSIEFSLAGSSVAEGAGTTLVQATLSAPSGLIVTAPITIGGTADDPLDFGLTPNPLVIPAGDVTAFFTASIVDDLLHELDETITLTLAAPAAATLGATTLHTLTILDDDAEPTVSFAAATSSALESVGTSPIDLTLSAASGLPVTVTLTTAGTATAGVDYTAPAASIVIPAGSTTETIALGVLQDLLDEEAETVLLTATGATGGTLGTPATHELTIIDDDNEPSVGFATANVSLIEDNGTASLDVVLSSVTGRDVTVNYSIAGTATAGTDYTAPASPVTILAGTTSVTISVPVTADLLDEPDETVVFTITSVVNALSGGISSSTLTITDDDDAPSVSFDLTSTSIGEGASATDVVVSLSGASGRTISVPFTAGGSATIDTDASLSATPLTFAPGSTSQTITITPIEDLLDENDETVVLTLGSPTNAILGANTTHTATLLDDDAAPTITLDPLPATVAEGGGPLTLTANLSSVSGLPVTASVVATGTATATVDYTQSGTTFSIPAGATSASITITLVDDAIFEGDETATWTIDTATAATIGVPATRTVTITDDETTPTVTFATASSFASEGSGTQAIALTLSGESSTDVTVPVTLTGTATLTTDYSAAPIPVIIPSGQTSASITITIVDDTMNETAETVILDLGTPGGATLGAIASHTFTISDDDGVPTVEFDVPTASLDESGGAVAVLVQLSSVSALDVTVPYTFGGTASATDHTTTASPLVIPAGSTQGTITITVIDDLLHEGNETLQLSLGLPTNASTGAVSQFTLTILDNDSAPEVRFTTTVQSAPEAAGSVTATLELQAVSGLVATIDLVTSGTATSGTDFTLAASQVQIPAGQLTATVTLNIVSDAVDEVDETVILTIDAASGATIGSPTTHTVTITDDDDLPTIAFAVATSSQAEGTGTATVDALLSAPSSLPITVTVTAGGTATASDFTLATTTLSFPAGQVAATASVTLLDDTVHEGTETVILTLSGPTGATLGSPAAHTLSILDDDPEPVVSFTVPSQSVLESDGTVTIGLTLTPASGLDAVIPFSVTGTATNGTDYSITASPLTIVAGATTANLSVTLTPDALDELTETIVVTLDTPTGATVGTNGAHTVSITDDDGQPSVAFELATSNAAENSGTALVRVVLSTPSGLTVTVPFADNGSGTATVGVDYTAPTSPLTIAPGATEAFISIPLIDDMTSEPDETIALQLLTPTNAIFGSPAAHTFTITDEDGVAPCSVAYPSPDVVYPPGVAITANVPTFACGTPTLWAITPALPGGLSFDTLTGTISGTPLARGPRVEYTVTASNPSGSDSTTVAIRLDPIYFYFGDDPTATYDPVSGDLIPAGGTTPDPLATVPVSLFLKEGDNNQPTPNTYTPTVGLSIALAYDALLIDPQQIDMGADIAALNPTAMPTGPEFWGPQIGTNVVTIGVLYTADLTGGVFETLTADVDREIAIIRYAPAQGSLVGNSTGSTVSMVYENPNGPTGVQNQVVLDGSTGVDPVTTNVVVTFQPQAP